VRTSVNSSPPFPPSTSVALRGGVTTVIQPRLYLVSIPRPRVPCFFRKVAAGEGWAISGPLSGVY
jgi:hypothetical protein